MPPQGGFEETENSLEGNSDEAALPVSIPVLKLPELPYAGPHGDNLVQRFKLCVRSFQAPKVKSRIVS